MTTETRHLEEGPSGRTPPRGNDLVPQVPDVVGMEVLEAMRFVRGLGLRLVVSVWETKIGPWGMVLSQQPQPGTSVRRGARVSVVMAGRPRVVVPDVRGLEADRASAILRRAGLDPRIAAERGSRLVPSGHVLSTRPRAGTLVFDGTPIQVGVARKPATGRRSDSGQRRRGDQGLEPTGA